MAFSPRQVVPIYSQVLSRHDESSASTPGPSHEILNLTLDAPSTAELSESGIRAVHSFLTAHDYKAISEKYPQRACAMEIAWIITGIQRDGQHEQPHPLFIENLKSGDWKSIRGDLKSLMFDSVSSFFIYHRNWC